MTAFVHIVMFEFKPDSSEQAIQDICQQMLGLREQCIHPQSGKPYIKAASGGKDNSPEGKQKGITHAFVVEFGSEEDRKYYLESDPAHIAFVKNVRGLVANVQVVDYTPNAF